MSDQLRSLRQLSRLMAQARAIEEEVHRQACQALPSCYVQWTHGGYPQEGAVESVVGFAGHTAVFVRNLNTGKRRRLDIRAIRFGSSGAEGRGSMTHDQYVEQLTAWDDEERRQQEEDALVTLHTRADCAESGQ